MGDKKHTVDVDLIRDLAEVLSANDIHEIEVEIEDGDMRVRLARHAPQAVAQPMMMAQSAAPAPAQLAAPAAAPAGSDDEPAAAPKADGTAVPSPMVGTAYLASAPGAEPFVRVGDKVSKGQTVMIVEAMKTMNQIPSPQDGTVKSISVEDGQPVEYGEPLLMLG